MKIKGHVVGIERCRALADQSRDNLRAAGLGGLLQSREIDIYCASAFSYTSISRGCGR